MTNEDKAQEICEKNGRYNPSCSSLECYLSALEMAAWKEQQMIDKAVEWLKDQSCYYHHWEVNGDTYENEIVVDTEKMVEDFKKAMEDDL